MEEVGEMELLGMSFSIDGERGDFFFRLQVFWEFSNMGTDEVGGGVRDGEGEEEEEEE